MRSSTTLQRMQVFYVNIGGGEPTVRPDFWELVDYATGHQVGVKFSTNGVRIDERDCRRLAGPVTTWTCRSSLDGATAAVNDAIRGDWVVRHGDPRHAAPLRGRDEDFKISVVCHSAERWPARRVESDRRPYSAQLRLTRLRPAGRGAATWDRTAPDGRRSNASSTIGWQAHGEQVLTGDSFFHLAAYGGALPGLNLCGAGRVVCLIDPVGDVYACPFAIHDKFLAGNVRQRRRVRGGVA